MAEQGFLFSDPPEPPPAKKTGARPSRRAGAGKRAQSAKVASTRAGKATSAAQTQQAATPAKTAQYSVTQLTRLIKLTLSERLPASIVLTGEISNFKRHSSGHLYLTLKDENAQIASVMWRSAAGRLKFEPQDGLAVQAVGHVDVYEPQGKYQFYIDRLEPAGTGALDLAFRQLAEKLRREGLFEEAHKKAIPRVPETIAIITSPVGAAIQDITQTLNRRWPMVRKLLFPVAVQGEAAGGEIAEALALVNRHRRRLGVDVIILSRGGGSLEDLWAFNEEEVARAVFASAIPVIVGVGHEVDTTIADMVADVRAATPTAAAELAVPVVGDMVALLEGLRGRLDKGLYQYRQDARQRLGVLASRPCFVRPMDMVRHRQQSVDEQGARFGHMMSEWLRRAGRTLEGRAAVLGRIEPGRALDRARGRLVDQGHRLAVVVREVQRGCVRRLEGRVGVLRGASPVHGLRSKRLELLHLGQRLERGQGQLLEKQERQLEHRQQRLANLNPRAVLRRGYSITRRGATGRVLGPEEAVEAGELLSTELDGSRIIESQVTQVPQQKEDSDE